ncbi:MAG: inositol monophosphatase [Chloroflexota bacterium]|nr:inositol monophosphatase [Chloroflexota bacterium]
MTSVDMDAVADILREAAVTAIVPRFRTLADHEIEEKAPGEVVTIADREAEAIISSGLRDLLPGVPVVGEEAVADDPTLMNAIHTEPLVWLVDPLDGTANFTEGNPHWAMMAALVRDGETVASWTYRHADDRLFQAERGSGAWSNGERLHCDGNGRGDASSIHGAVPARFLTEDERARMTPRFPEFAAVTGGFSCAGYEYPAIIDGCQDFALFQRLLPWDHAPGALLLTEAGGVAKHPDGRAFQPDARQRGLLLASSQAVWNTVRGVLYGD